MSSLRRVGNISFQFLRENPPQHDGDGGSFIINAAPAVTNSSLNNQAIGIFNGERGRERDFDAERHFKRFPPAEEKRFGSGEKGKHV